MEGHEILGKMKKVVAPPDFDQRVFYRLREARRERARHRTVIRYALAASGAVGLAAVIMVGGGLLRQGAFLPFGGQETALAEGGREAQAPLSLWGGEETDRPFVPVLETVDYGAEVRNASSEPRTVYILEQVSDVRSSGITY